MHFSTEQLIELLYLAVLNRAPDEAGLRAHSMRLSRSPDDVRAVASELFHSPEHQNRLGMSNAILDHSQFGEFPMLLRRLLRSGSKHQIIVDVGARGRERSNSYGLMRYFGWKGLLVEANPSLRASIERDFEGLDFRYSDCAIGVAEGTLPFYIGANDDVSSLLESAARGWGETRGHIDVEVRRLATLLREHAIPYDFDVLSLDIEGLDVDVLNDLIAMSIYRPHYIVIEASQDFAFRTIQDAGGSALVAQTYRVVDQTCANFILQRVP